MSERDALLRHVIEHADDDAPRLVMADWLDEHGEPARAEFVRTQCKLAVGVPNATRRRHLEQREAVLWFGHGDHWCKELPSWARKGAEFRRGFPFAVTAAPGSFLKGADALFRRSPTRGVRLGVRTFRHFDELLASPQLQRLSALVLDGLTPALAPIVANSPHLVNLSGLGVRGNVPMDWVPNLLASPRLAGLTSFGLCGEGGTWGATDSFARFIHLPQMHRITSLTLANSGLGAYHLDGVADAPGRPTELVLAGCRFGDEGVRSLVGHEFASNLTRLDLSGCNVTDAGLHLSAASRQLANLTDLDVSGNWPITLEGLRELGRSPHLVRLTRVAIQGTIAAGTPSVEMDRYPDGRVVFWPVRSEIAS